MNFQLRPHQQRGVDAMQDYSKGQIIVPTGGGKTLKMIYDAQSQFESSTPQTVVIVAPRILLANQLCSEFLEVIQNAKVFHVHSGETRHDSSTYIPNIRIWANKHQSSHKLFFTTYHSLYRIQESGISVDTIYFDEAHNSTRSDFFSATEYFSQNAGRCYFFTATPKHSNVYYRPGMNDSEVYGQVICEVPAPELVEGGYIVPPKVIVEELPMSKDKKGNIATDSQNLINAIDEHDIKKALICAKSTSQIVELIALTNFCEELESRGYSWMMITSKTGAIIDKKKVNREVFFETLNKWGKDDSKKFVVLHHSILSEGINVSGLEAVMFMRNMDLIGISQTIGRVIRLHQEDAKKLQSGQITPGCLDQYVKPFGLVYVPVYTKAGINTSRAVQSVVDLVFREGEAAVTMIEK